jgi:uncharacterized RDD family membrane protein YckC
MFDPYEATSAKNKNKKNTKNKHLGTTSAGFLRRAIAVIIDILIIIAFVKWYDLHGQHALFRYMQDNPESWLSSSLKQSMQHNFSNLMAMLVLIAATPMIINNGLFVWIFGGSIGQKIARTRVVKNSTMQRVGIIRSFWRLICCFPVIIIAPISVKMIAEKLSAGLTLDAMIQEMSYTLSIPYIFALSLNFISIFTVLFTRQKRAIHDMLAGTNVVK